MEAVREMARKLSGKGGTKMRLAKGILAALCVIALLLTATPLIMAQEATATFEVKSLKVEPSEAQVGRVVTITADITNTGEAEGTYMAILKINDKEEGSQEVILAAGETKTVEFSYVPAMEGSYTVTIGDKSAGFKAVAIVGEPKFRVGPTVYLRPVSDEINASQDGLMELYMDNPSLNDVTLHVDVRVHVPSGLHVYGQGFGLAAAAGTVYGQLDIPPGTARTVHMNIKAEKTGKFFVHLSGLYYPDENKDLYNPFSLTHPFTVTEPSPDPLDPNPTNPEQIPPPPPDGWPWWAWVIIVCVVLGGIALVVAVVSRRTEVTIGK